MNDIINAFRASILGALGQAPEVIEPGRIQRFATSNRRGDTAGWCKLFDDLRGGVFGCFRQVIHEKWSAVGPADMTRGQRVRLARQMLAATIDREENLRKRWAANGKRNAQMWAQSVPLAPGDPCDLYLKRRGLGGLRPHPTALRHHRGLPYWADGENLGTFPAMVAPLVGSDGRLVALHRTYLTADGQKAAVPSAKKVTGPDGPLAGTHIPLSMPARGVVGIAEGIETALAAMCASNVPTVAAYSACNLAAWKWPAGVQRLMIFGDADKAGRDAADTLQARALAARLRCEVMTPMTEGADWCDVWVERGALETAEGRA